MKYLETGGRKSIQPILEALGALEANVISSKRVQVTLQHAI